MVLLKPSISNVALLVFSLFASLYFELCASVNLNSIKSSSKIALIRNTRSLRMDRLWTRSGYGIVFVYSNTFSQYELQKIEGAVAQIQKHSCFPVRLFSQFDYFSHEFRRYPHYVFIEKNLAVGCGQAVVGMHGGYQLLTLSPDPRCLTEATIIHEMLHTLGMEHEQSRPDRNQYVQINNPNVQTGLHNVFNIAYGSKPYGPYDFDSIMHYGKFAFSISPNLPTISSKVGGHDVPFSANSQLSFWDKRKINFMTGCKMNS